MHSKITAQEARARLSDLLFAARNGRRFVITHRGKPVAELGPVRSHRGTDAKAAIETFEAFRKTHPVGRKIEIQELRMEGRK
ncbi:MAG: type II toxin-antitoxin system prevent-host-death family antitoxin [Proteobacteria bacterium]|nr:type II toxin-antitoxin system prevent-host-death family antitoxin [Pseudomonadota bacterium]